MAEPQLLEARDPEQEGDPEAKPRFLGFEEDLSSIEVPTELATLDEALAFLADSGCGIQLDLKALGAELRIAEALRRHDLVDRSVVSSFRPASLRALHELEPGLRLGLTYPEDRYGIGHRRLLAPLVGSALVPFLGASGHAGQLCSSASAGRMHV